jgi:hypothetical protein
MEDDDERIRTSSHVECGYARSEGWKQDAMALALLLVRELPAQALPCVFHAAADAILLALDAR